MARRHGATAGINQNVVVSDKRSGAEALVDVLAFLTTRELPLRDLLGDPRFRGIVLDFGDSLAPHRNGAAPARDGFLGGADYASAFAAATAWFAVMPSVVITVAPGAEIPKRSIPSATPSSPT